MVRVSLGLAMFAGLTGCLSVRERIETQTIQVQAGDYASAYAAAAEAATGDDVDTPFWSAEAGTLALMAGTPAAAIPHLDAADNGFNDVARRYNGAGAMDTLAATLGNDCALPYAPEGLDRVFANLYKALAYGATGDIGGMRVELNRARQRQYEWFYRCTEDIAEADTGDLSEEEAKWVRAHVAEESGHPARLSAAVAEAASQESADAARLFGNLRGFGNAYASHVTGVARWCAGDASRNDLAMAAALAPGNATAQADLAAEKAGRRPKDRVWVYVEDGLAPHRVEVADTFTYPSIAGHLQGIGTISYAVPKLQERAAASSSYSVNGVALQPLLDVDALAQDQFDRAWPGILTRQIVRTLTRVATHEVGQAIIHEGAKNSDNVLAWMAASLAYSAAVAAWDVSTNEADLRCADLLPKTVWMGALPRPADGVVRVTPAGGQTVTVQLRGTGNALVWVRRPTATGPATVMTIDLDKKE